MQFSEYASYKMLFRILMSVLSKSVTTSFRPFIDVSKSFMAVAIELIAISSKPQTQFKQVNVRVTNSVWIFENIPQARLANDMQSQNFYFI